MGMVSTFRLQTRKGWVMFLPDSSPWTINATFTTYSSMDFQPGFHLEVPYRDGESSTGGPAPRGPCAVDFID